jgi:hypothetical protein
MMPGPNPSPGDGIVGPDLYGDLLSGLAAGLVGGVGLTPQANLSEDHAIFEAVHGSVPEMAGMMPLDLVWKSISHLRCWRNINDNNLDASRHGEPEELQLSPDLLANASRRLAPCRPTPSSEKDRKKVSI